MGCSLVKQLREGAERPHVGRGVTWEAGPDDMRNVHAGCTASGCIGKGHAQARLERVADGRAWASHGKLHEKKKVPAVLVWEGGARAKYALSSMRGWLLECCSTLLVGCSADGKVPSLPSSA